MDAVVGSAGTQEVGVLIPRTSGRDLTGSQVFTKGVQFKTRLSGQVLINRSHVLMAKGRPDTDADAEGRRCPQADGGLGHRRNRRRRPPICDFGLRMEPRPEV